MNTRLTNFWLCVGNITFATYQLFEWTSWPLVLVAVNLACAGINLAGYLREPVGVVRGGELTIRYRDCR